MSQALLAWLRRSRDRLADKKPYLLGAGHYGLVLRSGEEAFKYSFKPSRARDEYAISKRLLRIDNDYFSSVVLVVDGSRVGDTDMMLDCVLGHLRLLDHLLDDVDESRPLSYYAARSAEYQRAFYRLDSHTQFRLQALAEASPLWANLAMRMDEVIAWLGTNSSLVERRGPMVVWRMPVFDGTPIDAPTPLLLDSDALRRIVTFTFVSFYSALSRYGVLFRDLHPGNLLLRRTKTHTTHWLLEHGGEVLEFVSTADYEMRLGDLSFTRFLQGRDAETAWYDVVHWFLLMARQVLDHYEHVDQDFERLSADILGLCRQCVSGAPEHTDSHVVCTVDWLRMLLSAHPYFAPLRRRKDSAPDQLVRTTSRLGSYLRAQVYKNRGRTGSPAT